jgi:hypothetical protein
MSNAITADDYMRFPATKQTGVEYNSSPYWRCKNGIAERFDGDIIWRNELGGHGTVGLAPFCTTRLELPAGLPVTAALFELLESAWISGKWQGSKGLPEGRVASCYSEF